MRASLDTSSSSLILLSGGLDSAANLAFCVEQGKSVRALTFDYGQKAAAKELAAASALCRYYGVPHQTLDAKWLGLLGGSALTSAQTQMPEPSAEDLDHHGASLKSAKQVWVPNRNGVFIEIAAAFAESAGAQEVVVGFNREEAATFPDNSVDYLHAISKALSFSTANGVRIYSYTAEWDKREIVQNLMQLKIPFPAHLVWSCYLGEERSCRKCESCLRFQRAFQASREVFAWSSGGMLEGVLP